MKPRFYKKSIVFAILVVLIGAVAVPSISGNNTTNSENIVKPLSRGEVFFSDDFNDNSKDMTKWTEIYGDGTWWERNQQTELRLYESGGVNHRHGILSKGIPLVLDDDPVVVECIMDTLVDNYPDPWYQWIGTPSVMVVDADNKDNYIQALYRRDINQIIVEQTGQLQKTIGSTDDFSFKVTITINIDKYMVEVGPYTSGWIAESIFPSECTIQVRLLIKLAGDYPSFWWIAGFDDVVVSKGEGSQDPDKPAKPSGPTSGKPGEEYTYTTYYSDPEEGQVYYMWDWADGTFSDWIGPYESGETTSATHSWDDLGTYNIRVKAKDINNNETEWSNPLAVIIENNPPDIPQINGPTSGVPGNTYSYSFVTIDPDDDDIFYEIDWGDGQVDSWAGPYMSNEVITKSHSWDYQGNFRIRVRAKDTFGNIGDWGELEVIIPRDKTFNNPFIQFLKSHPYLFPLLQTIIQQLGFGL
jgi:hypothetical protein